MEDHYGIHDLRQLISGRPHFPAIPPPPPPPPQQQDFFSEHRNLTPPHHLYDMLMVNRHNMMPHDFRPNNSPTMASPTGVTITGTTSSGTLSGLETETGCHGGDGGNGRWPRQETLTLLEIRSYLDTKFKEANQKGPLWDEVSRIMSEEHGYQRSGKKCREKFENLYKYYKKTKDGKAGRQDGKHYRFFRQLEALYGETSNPLTASNSHFTNGLQFHARSNNTSNNQVDNQEAFQSHTSISPSNSSGFDTSSSEDNDLNITAYMENDLSEKLRKRRGRRNWKAKIKHFIDSQMRKLMEKQEAWLEKMMKTIEGREHERLLREDEWRRNEAERIEREHKFWVSERAWIEARDAALMEALGNISGREARATSTRAENNANEKGNGFDHGTGKGDGSWPESEITRLLQLRTSMELRFEQIGCSEEILWEEIAAKMACLGYDRSALMCKNKWDSINSCLRRTNNVQESSFRLLMGGENEWDSNYSIMKLIKGGPNQ